MEKAGKVDFKETVFCVDILESKDMNGMTGEKGEPFCVFAYYLKYPENSFVYWFFTRHGARRKAGDLLTAAKTVTSPVFLRENPDRTIA
ncbi:MAG TPA: hypothetical protein PKW51_08955 [Methanoregulaceae archaeon]|jgi:hypothetical protein|nr:hypothetical protein [Methanoregulaceae archaeon]HQO65025.1 hypothetical protein [Syntrophorhabdus sp.]HQP56868.1 hypothetical protein [Syntrophorhabdus sp.]